MKRYLGGDPFNNILWHTIFYNKHKACHFYLSTIRKMTVCLNTVRLLLRQGIFTSVCIFKAGLGEGSR